MGVKYEDPRHNVIDKKPAILCVLCSFVPFDQIDHYELIKLSTKESIPYIENKSDSVKFTLTCHEHYTSGVDYDIIIVDNDSKDPEFLDYLKTLKYPVYHRPNEGFSFGAFKWAWENIKGYDYYLFQEQDISPAKDGWLLEIFNKFTSDRKIGAIGNVVEVRGKAGAQFNIDFYNKCLPERDWSANLDGPYTFTSRQVLEHVDKIGGLRVFPINDGLLDPCMNECIFQYPIMELGYELDNIGRDGNHIFSHGACLVEQHGSGEMAPMIHCHTRFYYNKDYFNWYNK